ncbi:MAG: hemerythrin domain-containing protein [Acidobacteria bacterium]|uniref:Hemerythrin domain-containing protein n=1 Tax=Candidatus Polarisedimenticola svalbardensis TaxID=2886004 RepID=A0A8J6Y4C5_9BACT|nr:hemerythrin domain-containing protein [Candidatus Polarisedimenticola svalbardensis]
MNTPPADTAISRQSLEEHEQIHFFLDRLEEALAELDPESGAGEALERLVAVIAGFKEQIVEHNRVEEEVLFQAIVDRVPEAEDEILALSEEHRKVLEILEMARIHARNSDSEEVGFLRDDLTDYLGMIREHESREAELLRQALSRESRGLLPGRT